MLNAGDQALEDENLDEELRRFWDRYPMDDRATTLLLGCPLHLQRRVIDTFDPKNKQEVDYSRQVTGYIRSLQGEDMAGRKRGYEEDHDGAMVGKRARVDVAFPTEAEIAKFCTRYPIDDRAVDYLLSSDAAVQQKVLSEFRPKVENEPDYSSLVTSLVKKMRAVVSTHSAHTPGSPGPTLERLKEFKDRFPMDERAWDFLLLASGHVQEIVVNEFQPRRPDDAEFSAAVTAFVRSMSKPHMDSNCISRAKLDGFRERYPMDDRAFEYLCTAGTDLQSEVLRNFAPKNENETDYSRQITAFLNLRSKTVSQGGGYTPREAPPWRLRDGETHPRGSVFANSGHFGHRDDGKGDKGDGKGGGLLRAFRARYPMDDRAFDYLQQAEQNVQEMFLAEFQPKRRGMDDDYSASVTSFLKVVRNKIANSGHAHTNAVAGGDDALLEGFRRRYPMDDRAFEYLCQQREDLRRKVVDTFRPKFEGEADYSSLVTSFIRSCRRW